MKNDGGLFVCETGWNGEGLWVGGGLGFHGWAGGSRYGCVMCKVDLLRLFSSGKGWNEDGCRELKYLGNLGLGSNGTLIGQNLWVVRI